MSAASNTVTIDASTPLLGDNRRPDPQRWWRLALSWGGAAVFLVTTSLLPVLNKELFSGHDFHFPLFTTTIYLLLCSAAGVPYFLVRYAASSRSKRRCFLCRSWWRKIVVATYPLGVAFGLKLGLTNYGLDLVTVEYHVLLQATAILWTALFGYVVLHEVPTGVSCVLMGTMIAGQLLLSLHFSSEPHASVLGIAVNLVSPVLEGVCIVFMRFAVTELFPPWITKHRAGQGNASLRRALVPSDCRLDEASDEEDLASHADAVIAFTLTKLFVSAMTCAPFAAIKEGFMAATPFWRALIDAREPAVGVLILWGSLLTLLLQSSLVVASLFSLALSLGILCVVKVVPQFVAGEIYKNQSLHPTPLHLAGIAIILASSVVYAFVRHHK